MMRRSLIFASVLGLTAVGAAASGAREQHAPVDPAMLAGSWRVVSIYDEFEDGRRRETWGPNPDGILQVTVAGMISAQLVGTARQPRPGTVPTDPVGPIVSYFGTFTMDGLTLVTHVQHASWPQWNGATVRRTVAELTASRLSIVADPIRDPERGLFRPHLVFERIN